MPHVPIYTQPTLAEINRISPYPILQQFTDSNHQNFVQSTVRGKAARGLASIEYVFEAREPIVPVEYEVEARLRVVQEAEEWERRGRDRVGARGAPTPTPA